MYRGPTPSAPIGSWGLFPAGRPDVSVVVPTPFSASKWGTSCLVPREMAALHDVPILASNLLLFSFFAAAPSKVLAVGLDVMNSSFLQGVLGTGILTGRFPCLHVLLFL